MLPSLFTKRVIRKQNTFVYQKRRIPDPLARPATFPKPAQLKNPKLSKTIAITIVAIMVTAAPPMVCIIMPKSDRETLLLRRTNTAPHVAGMASFTWGRQKINRIVPKEGKDGKVYCPFRDHPIFSFL